MSLLRFVVKKHDATHLHYDLRFELDGVMQSWVLPKGPSVDPDVTRLAIEVGDHSILHYDREHVISAGRYGAGAVMRWERGTYGPVDGGGEDALRRGYEAGLLTIVMWGERLRGIWTLKYVGTYDGRRHWLFVKQRDAYARPGCDIVADCVTSTASGRTIEGIRNGDKWLRHWDDAQLSLMSLLS